MSTTLILILTVLAVFLAYAVVAPFAMNLGRFLGQRWVYCPDRGETAQVRLNAAGAALSTAYGNPRATVRGCSVRNPGALCDEKCLEGEDV